MKGVKILYDSFFKEIMNPEYTPDRLARFLSLVLGKQVRIRQVLPNDSSRIADENSLLITDILVEFDDGSLANVEIKKIGYAFPGERSACYSADLLLQQYKEHGIRKSGKKENSVIRISKMSMSLYFLRKAQVNFTPFPENICINPIGDLIQALN